MSTPTKTAAQKTPEKASEPAKRAPRKPRVDIDFTGISPVPADEVKKTRSSVLDGTPIRELMAESRKGNVARIIQVPEAAADQVKNMFRLAAKEAGHGVKFGRTVVKGGLASVHYQAAEKKKFTPRKKQA